MITLKKQHLPVWSILTKVRLIVFLSFLYLKPHWQFQNNKKSLLGKTVKWKFLTRLWLLCGLKHILKDQKTLGVSDQILKCICWTKHLEHFLWTINSPRADGFMCWLLIMEPSSLFFQDKLCNWRTRNYCYQEPGFSAPGLNKLRSVFYQSKETFHEFQPASQICWVGNMI